MNNIFLKEKDKKTIRDATKISLEIMLALKEKVVEGISAFELDEIAGELLKKHNVVSSFKGVPGTYYSYPSNICVMNNDESVHAIPKSTKPFVQGDIVKVDMGIIYNDFFTDHGFTVGIGNISKIHRRMIETVELSVNQAVQESIAGNTTGDISHVLGSISKLAGFDSVTSYAGHGIGKYIHLDPSIPFQGQRHSGAELKEGMLICVENWITDGRADLKVDSDGWTDRTVDGSVSAFYEHMVLVGKDEAEILTL